MVYAPYGRAGIYMLQEFCRDVGIKASEDAIRDLVIALGALPAGILLARLLHEAPDFRQEAALADALLHPHDRAYSVPQLMDYISSAGLVFSRWVRQCWTASTAPPRRDSRRRRQSAPRSNRRSNLPLPNCFAVR